MSDDLNKQGVKESRDTVNQEVVSGNRRRRADAGSDNYEANAPSDGNWPVVNRTAVAEKGFDLAAKRALQSPSGVTGTIAYLIKGALGAGILGSHCGFASSGAIALPLTAVIGVYMAYCLHLLVISAQIIYKRTAITKKLSYAEVAEAALAISASKKVRKCARCFRYFIEFCIMLDLFGACTCYQLMISKTIKQLVEGTQAVHFQGKDGYPHFKIYMIIFMFPIIGICLIKNLTILGKISIVGNIIVLLCIIAAIYYSLKENASMIGMVFITSFKGIFTFTGITVFSMSCSGIVISLESNIKEPNKFPRALAIGMFFITIGIAVMGFFGYSAYGADSQSPITVHFPMTSWVPKFLKIGIALMLVITHAVNFWVPFDLLFYYIKKLHPARHHNCMEYIYRAIACAILTFLGIIFPSVNKLMAFLGAFCLSNMAFIYPALIHLAVIWNRPGLGPYKWRLVQDILLILLGLVMFAAGTFVSFRELLEIFGADDSRMDELETVGFEYDYDYYDYEDEEEEE